MVLGHYKLVVLGTWWRRVIIGLLCLYILKRVEIRSGVNDVLFTDRQTSKYSATQLV